MPHFSGLHHTKCCKLFSRSRNYAQLCVGRSVIIAMNVIVFIVSASTPAWPCFVSKTPCWFTAAAPEGHIQPHQTFLFLKREKKLLTFVSSADDQLGCWWVGIMNNQIQSRGGGRVNPRCDPATICVPVLLICLLCSFTPWIHPTWAPNQAFKLWNTEIFYINKLDRHSLINIFN